MKLHHLLLLPTVPLLLLGTSSCIRVKSDPVEVKPIHITLDINVKVAKELKGFFDDLDAADPTMKTK